VSCKVSLLAVQDERSSVAWQDTEAVTEQSRCILYSSEHLLVSQVSTSHIHVLVGCHLFPGWEGGYGVSEPLFC